MNIRKLIEKALDEAREEFAAIVARKLEELMGDADREPPKRAAAKKSGSKPASRQAVRTRAPESHIAALRAKVIAAMPVGQAMKRAQIAEAAGLPPSEALRLSNVLRKLKDENVLAMRGTKASATYTRKG